MRAPWHGKLSESNHQWLTGSSLLFSKNWYREEPINIKFAMLSQPASVEFPTIRTRDPYTSYPPGTIIPLYLISKIEGKEPNLNMIMNYNLANHFLITLFLSIMVFFFLSVHLKLDLVNSTLFATIPIFIELFTAGPLYWHQNVFFSDQAIILPFVIYIFLEIIRPRLKERVILISLFQYLIVFYGILTDWFFISIVLTVYLKRLINKEINLKDGYKNFILKTFYFWMPVILVIVFFIIQVYLLQNIDQTLSKMMVRTSLDPSSNVNLLKFIFIIKDHLTKFYGDFAWIALIIILFLLLLLSSYSIIQYTRNGTKNERLKDTLLLAWMLLLPCLIHNSIFKNHTIFHNFSVLKYSVPLSIIPFVLIPISIYLILERQYLGQKSFFIEKKLNINLKLSTIFMIAFLLVLVCLKTGVDYHTLFPPPNEDYNVLGGAIENYTSYNDILFSPDFEIPVNPPQQLSLSMKRVYKIDSIEDVKDKIKELKQDYNVIIIFIDPPEANWKPYLENSTLKIVGNYYFYRLSPNIIYKLESE